jgi:hypothetical protein
MSWNKTDRSFKILINRRVTDAEPSKYWYNEKGDYTLDLHASEIKTEDIPSTPPGADTAVVDVYNYAGRLTLIEDTSVPGKMTWFASTESNTVLAQTDEGARLKDWIPDKYGSGYAIALYDGSDVQIPYSDASGWYFDYPTGILTFANASTDSGSVSSRAPYKIVGYRYIGAKGNITPGGGTTGTIAKWTSSTTLGDSILTESSDIITVAGKIRSSVSKSFYIPHPVKPGWYLEHGCLEGPENGIYHRGFHDGEEDVTITLPEYWEPLNGDDYDVYITSYGNYNLYVSNKTAKDFTVSRCKTWKWRKKSIRFSFIVVGGRINAPIELEFDATKQSAP